MLQIAELHPIVVHFPIVFFLSLAFFDTLALLRGNAVSGRTVAGSVSVSLAVLAGIFAVITFLAGDLAYDAATAAGVKDSLLETHEALGTWTAIFVSIWAIFRTFNWWRGAEIEGGRKVALVMVEIVGALAIITTAYFGGQLVYKFGVNVNHATGIGQMAEFGAGNRKISD